MIQFTVHGKPEPGGSKRAFVIKGTKRASIVDANKNAKPWKESVSRVATETMEVLYPLQGPLALELTFFRPRPKGHYKGSDPTCALKASAPSYPIARPDVLKLARSVEDAMTGIVYLDDAQICTEILTKRFGSPRVEVKCYPVVEDLEGS